MPFVKVKDKAMVTDRPPIVTVRHVGIVVRDLARSLEFYRDALGLTIARDMKEQGLFIDEVLDYKNTRVHTVKLATITGNTQLELLSFDCPILSQRDATPVIAIGITHVALQVDNLINLYAKLLSIGVRFQSPPRISPDGRALVAFCFDPDNNALELVELRQSSPHKEKHL